MNLSLYGYRRAMADDRLRHHLRRRHHARRRGDHARSRLHRGTARVLAGLVATHAHEDHIGAIPYLWPRLQCPVYATPFTAAVLRLKLPRPGSSTRCRSSRCRCRASSRVGPFELELITLTHSIPEPNAVVLRTPLGTVLHTGDWKFDPEPLVGRGYRHGGAASASATRACSPWSAIRPMRCGPARPGSEARCARRAHRARRRMPRTASPSPASPPTSRGSKSAAAAAARA